ncbi:MAG TPA: hypothetical protein VFX97_16835 [Pyrinomonadaceae bacterium]|nr:hypothetical protein [Pyrinomonadaceae bacterium]
MKKLSLCFALLLFAVPAFAQQSMRSGGGEVSISRTGQTLIKSRSDKSITVSSPVADLTVVGALNSCVDAGANDTYTCSLSPAPLAYATGQVFWFKAATANTTAATVNFNSLGAKTIKKVAGGITTDLATGDIRAGQWVALIYDGTNMQMLSDSGAVDAGGTVTSVSGTANQISVATGTTTPVLSLPAAITAPGTLTITTSLTVGSGTAVTRIGYYTASLTPAEVAANTCAEELFTVTGITAGDAVFVNKPTAQAGLGIGGVRASGANQVGINFCNNTGAPITPTAAQSYIFGVIR